MRKLYSVLDFTFKKNAIKVFGLMIIAVMVMESYGWAQTATDGDYRSRATGLNWSGSTTWQVRAASSWSNTSIPPTSANNVYIQSGHTITADAATQACNALHIHTSGVLAIGTNTVQVNGKIRAYTGTAVTTIGADGTFYTQTSSTAVVANNITSTSGSGKVSFTGTTRNITLAGEWGATLTGTDMDVSLTSGNTGTPGTNMKARNWTFTSGIFDCGTTPRIISADNGTTGQTITILTGAVFIGGGAPIFQRTGTTSAGTLNLNSGGILRIPIASPTIAVTTLNLNGTVEYTRSGIQTLMTAVQSGGSPNTYTNLTLNGTNAKTLGLNTTVNGLLTIDGTATNAYGAFTLGFGSSASVAVNTGGGFLLNTGTYGAATNSLTINPNQTINPALSNTSTSTWAGTTAINADSRLTAAGSTTLTLSGAVTGSGLLLKDGAGNLILGSSGNNITGATTINNGTLTVNSGSSMGTGVLTMFQTATNNTALALNESQTVSALSSSFTAATGSQTQIITVASGKTLTVNQSTNTTYGSGAVSTLTSTISGAGSLSKSGSGTLTLGSANGYTGGTGVNAGSLSCGIAAAIPSAGTMTLNGGTLQSGGFTQSTGTLSLTDNSVIALGAGVHSITFAASNGVSWTSNKTLNITGWAGSTGVTGTAGKIFVGNSAAGLTSTQLSQISFGGVNGAALLSSGELVPAPTITSLGSTSGCVGSSITINGTNLGTATVPNVKIGGTAVTAITSQTSTQIVATIGSGTTGTVTVTDGGATATSAATFTVVQPPTTSTNGGSQTACKGTTTAALGGNTPTSGSGQWSCTAAPAGGSTGDITFTDASNGNTTAIVSSGAIAGAYTLAWTISNAPCTPSASTLTLTVSPDANAGTVSGTSPMCIGNTATYTSTGDAGGTWTSTNTGVATVDAATGLVTAIAAGTTNITYTVNSGCNNPSAAFQTLIVSPLITSGTVNGSTPICIGATTLYTSDGTVGGTWSSTNTAVATVNAISGLVTGVSAGTSDITYSVLSPCGFTQSSFKTITVSPDANPGTISGTTPICTGSTTTYSTNGDGGGTWSSTNPLVATVNAASGLVTALTNGTTNITYTLNSGCNAPQSSFKTLTVSNGSVWVGTTAAWNTGSNWCSGAVPTSSSDVTIPSGTPNDPLINSGVTASVHNISIASGATLTVSGTGTLKLYGAISNSGILDMTDGTLDLAGTGVSVGGGSFSTATIKNLTISNGGSSSITSGGANTLKVTGDVEFTTSGNTFTTNGNLTLVSSATATASIKDITNNGTLSGNSVSGNASVERYIAAGRKYRFLAVNTTGGALTVQNSWMEGQAPGANSGPVGYGMWITGRPSTGFDADTYAPTMKWWDGSVYTGIINPTTYDIRSHNAYMVYIRGDRSQTGSNVTTAATVLRTTGGLSQGTAGTTTIAAGSDYIAVSNPYASAVDLTKCTYSTSGVINVAIWDPNLTGYYGLGGFQNLTSAGSGADFTITPGGGSYGADGSVMNMIESGQAFFIQGSGASRNISFEEVAKTPKSHDVFFAAGTEQILQGTLLTRETNNTLTVMDGMQVRFDNQYNTTLDPDDARKMSNLNENVGVLRGAKSLAVEYRNVPSADDTVKLTISGMRIKDYRWKFTLTNMDAPGRVGFLKDQFLGTNTSLNLNGTNTVDFSVTSNAASYAADRFMIVFKPANVLAVNLTTISANRRSDANIDVKWQAENETAIDHYETERSADGRTFTKLGNTAPTNNAGGTASYLYTDTNPLSGSNYYHVVALGTNGRIQETTIVKVSPFVKEGMISIYPNPTDGTTVAVHFEGKARGKYIMNILNDAGQKIYNEQINLQSNNEVKQIRFTKKLAAGIYQLIIMAPDGKSETKQIVAD